MLSNSLNLGLIAGSTRPLILPASARERHLYVCGGTGVGKSKFLENCIRQDIMNWHDSHSGLLLLDPHGLVYENTMAWLAKNGLMRKVIPIDLRRNDWIISYNLLRKQKELDPAVIVANFVQALAHVWGKGGTDETPLFAKWAAVILLTLYQNGYTVLSAMQLLSRSDIRRAMSANVTNPVAQQAWLFAEQYPREFETQITSTISRFNRLLGPEVMQATFGQPDVSFDLLSALNEGHIILVNLSTKGGQITKEDADTFGTLLLADLWAAAQVRGKAEREKMRPFYVYIDECQNFITPTIADNLDQARGFGLHFTLANQFPYKLLESGPHGRAMYNSILANAGDKVVFRLEHPEDAEMLAKWLFMGTFDTDQVKLALKSTKVIGYREEMREVHTTGTSISEGKSSGYGRAAFSGGSSSHGTSGGEAFNTHHPDNASSNQTAFTSTEGWNETFADTYGDTESWSENETSARTESKSVSRMKVLIPVIGQELSSVQYRSIDEQVFQAMQRLFDQEDRHFVIRYAGGPKAPLFVTTPTVEPSTTRPEYVEKYRRKLLKKLPYALPKDEAMKRVKDREQKLIADVVDLPLAQEPKTARRRVK